MPRTWDLDKCDFDDVRIKRAVQLCFTLVMSRSLVYRGYAGFQYRINNAPISTDPAKDGQLCSRLGSRLLGLRWCTQRVLPSFHIEVYVNVETLVQLAKVLYFYYCALKMKLPRHISVQEGLEDLQDFQVMDGKCRGYYPYVNSIEGYEAWLERGRELQDRRKSALSDQIVDEQRDQPRGSESS